MSTKRRSPAAEEERAFLDAYRPGDYPRPSVATDIVVFTVIDGELRVLLIQRDEPPFKGAWALPGGFVRVGEGKDDQGEDLDAAAARELAEETGLSSGLASAHRVFLAQLGAFGRPGRDPRMRVISIAYYALVPPDLVPLVRAGGDAGGVEWFAIERLKKVPLAFDHEAIIAAARARIVRELWDSTIAFSLVPRAFSIPELRHVHAVVTGEAIDAGNFRRRFQRMLEDGVVEEAPGIRITASRPAKLYRLARGAGG